jgi:hypothetical protein
VSKNTVSLSEVLISSWNRVADACQNIDYCGLITKLNPFKVQWAIAQQTLLPGGWGTGTTNATLAAKKSRLGHVKCILHVSPSDILWHANYGLDMILHVHKIVQTLTAILVIQRALNADRMMMLLPGAAVFESSLKTQLFGF